MHIVLLPVKAFFVAWLYKQKKSRFWWLGWRVNGKIHFRSLKTEDRKEAEKELAKVHVMFNAKRAGTALEAVYETLTGKTIPKVTLKTAIEQWLAEVNEATRNRYASIAAEFAEFLGATEHGPIISDITTEHVREYLHKRRSQCSISTLNLERKILSVFFRRAMANGQLKDNPVSPIRHFEATDTEEQEQVQRRPFTLDELRLMYSKAPSDFWRYMIVGEAYTGLRMGDLITLDWQRVDLPGRIIRLAPRKTRAKRIRVHVPIAAPFMVELQTRHNAVGKPASGYIWPDEAERYAARKKAPAAPFSNEFYELILQPCGLVPERKNKKGTGKGRSAKRQINPVSFHSLRHSFVTLLKASGSHQAIAKALAGHTSDLVSDLYTDLPEDVLADAINRLPRWEEKQ